MLIFVFIECFGFDTLGIIRYAISDTFKIVNCLFTFTLMQQIKDFLNFLDYIVATFWGFTVIEIMPLLTSGSASLTVLNSVSEFIKVLFAIAGLIYLIVRLMHFIKMSKINIDIRKEELEEKKNANFYKKFNNEFIDKK